MTAHGRKGLGSGNTAGRSGLALIALAGALALGLAGGGTDGTAPADPTLQVDPNLVPRSVLLALPRVSPALAGRMEAARREAPFRSLDDLDARVRGIGPATTLALRPYLRFGPVPPASRP